MHRKECKKFKSEMFFLLMDTQRMQIRMYVFKISEKRVLMIYLFFILCILSLLFKKQLLMLGKDGSH